MNKLPKEKREKLMMVALGTGAVLVAVYMLVITAQQSALESHAQNIASAQEKLRKAEHWTKMGPSIKARLAACRTELDQKQDEFAPLDKFKWFYNTLEKFLTKYRVNLVDITREPEIGEVGALPKFPFQAATFGVKLRARYHEFGSCLAEFENAFPYMRVQNIELEPEVSATSSNKNASASETLAITMRVVTLVKPNVPL